MEYFENTTRITKDGYAAILQMKRKQHHMVCRALGILLAIPFLERLIYNFILLCLKDRSDFHFDKGYLFFISSSSVLFNFFSITSIFFSSIDTFFSISSKSFSLF